MGTFNHVQDGKPALSTLSGLTDRYSLKQLPQPPRLRSAVILPKLIGHKYLAYESRGGCTSFALPCCMRLLTSSILCEHIPLDTQHYLTCVERVALICEPHDGENEGWLQGLQRHAWNALLNSGLCRESEYGEDLHDERVGRFEAMAEVVDPDE